MANKFLSKEIIISAIIFFGGLAAASGILVLANFTNTKPFVASQSVQWTQETGAGFSAPACASTVTVTCDQNGVPVVDLSWAPFDTPQDFAVGLSFQDCGIPSHDPHNLTLPPYVYGRWLYQDSGSFHWDASFSPAPKPNTTYYWHTTTEDQNLCGQILLSGSFTTPNCASPPGDFRLSQGAVACNSVGLTWQASAGADGYRILRDSPRVDITPYNPYTALNFTDTTVSQGTRYKYQIEAYNDAGVNRSNAIDIDVPSCLPTLNFSGNPTSIFEGQSSTLTWLSTFATSCTASGAWSGSKAVNGSEVVIPSPPPSVTYTLTCTGPGGSTGPQSVTINIMPLALPNWREIIPR